MRNTKPVKAKIKPLANGKMKLTVWLTFDQQEEYGLYGHGKQEPDNSIWEIEIRTKH